MAGMRINTGSGIDPKMVDQLVELERQPIKLVEEHKKNISDEKKVFSELKGLVATLGTTLNAMRTRTDFFKLKLESTQPEIVDGTVDKQIATAAIELLTNVESSLKMGIAGRQWITDNWRWEIWSKDFEDLLNK